MALSLSKGPPKTCNLLIILTKLAPIFLICNMTAWFYILRPQSNSLYIGATKDLKRRYTQHCAGSAGRTTALDPPDSIVYSEEHGSFSSARRREPQIKRWSRAKKEALVAGEKDKLRALSKSREADKPSISERHRRV